MKPPKNLSREGRNLWRKIQDEYGITDEAGLLILATGLEAFDRMRQAQEILSSEGMTAVDRFGQPRAHPAATIERDSRAAMLGALKQLNLDIEPLRDGPGRPPGGDDKMPSNRKRVSRAGKNDDWMRQCHYFGECKTKYSDHDRRRCLTLTVWDRQDPLSSWADVEAKLLSAFIREHPCTRPWSWWREAAPEPRRQVGGTGEPGKYVQFEFGAPTSNTWWAGINPDDPPAFESQAVYLQRHGLLTEAENRWLAQHPGALEPEKIEYLVLRGPGIRSPGSV